ncbi:MAG: PQQ-dependent sugar dehydrogenase, partial [Planctomycetales bacterium]|nr:PQQ-dependent sugar dehydrogenase [Planctomycetales bacterium]
LDSRNIHMGRYVVFARFILGGILILSVSLVKNARAEFPPVFLEPITQGELVSPVAITNAGDGSNRLFVVEQRGLIRVMENGALNPTPFLDISGNLVPERDGFDERGLLGLAFHPNFGNATVPGNDKFYVYYSAPQPNGDPDDPVNPVNHQSVVAEYSVSGPGLNVANPNSQRILMTFNEPQFNHDGGEIAFGPDNMLYILTGDGGGGGDNEPGHTGGGPNDPSGGLGNSQDRSTLLGKVLRIDPMGTNGPGGQYGIPADNPFVGEAGVREEIYAYGLRNPWRASFDNGPGGTNRMFIADVGQGDVEEINILEAGANYGWRIKEGSFDFDASVSPDPAVELTGPIAEYAHPNSENGLPKIGVSVTGGVVYRGETSPELQGKYIFGDWSASFRPAAGTLLGLEEVSPGNFDLSVLDVVGGNPIDEYILAFGRDENGEVYMATKATLAPSELGADGLPTGAIYRINAVPEPSNAFPMALAVFAFVALTRRTVRRT